MSIPDKNILNLNKIKLVMYLKLRNSTRSVRNLKTNQQMNFDIKEGTTISVCQMGNNI